MRSVIQFLAALILGLTVLTTSAQAQDGYGIRPGDVLKIEVLEDPSLNRSVLVAPDGRISMPLAGSVLTSGRSVDQVAAEIATRIASNFAAAPNVFVSLERLAERPAGTGAPAAAATIDIYVMGEAMKPGKLEVTPGTTVLQLFAQMGGFSKFAAVKRIQLRRGGKIWTLDYKAIESGSSPQGATVLADGDVIVVPQRKLFE